MAQTIKKKGGVCLQCRRPGFNPWVGKILWRRKWQPTPVLLPGKFHGLRSLVGYSPWDHKELDTTEWLHFHQVLDTCFWAGFFLYEILALYCPWENTFNISFFFQYFKKMSDISIDANQMDVFKILCKPFGSQHCWLLFHENSFLPFATSLSLNFHLCDFFSHSLLLFTLFLDDFIHSL